MCVGGGGGGGGVRACVRVRARVCVCVYVCGGWVVMVVTLWEGGWLWRVVSVSEDARYTLFLAWEIPLLSSATDFVLPAKTKRWKHVCTVFARLFAGVFSPGGSRRRNYLRLGSD